MDQAVILEHFLSRINYYTNSKYCEHVKCIKKITVKNIKDIKPMKPKTIKGKEEGESIKTL